MRLYELMLPRETWVSVTTSDAKSEIADELVGLVKNAYSDTVHGSFVNSVTDVMPSNWLVVNATEDGKINAAIFYRKSRSGENWSGFKIQGIGHDGNGISKRRLINQLHKLLNKQGWWIESSNSMSRTLKLAELPTLTDESTLRELFGDPTLKMIASDIYSRSLPNGTKIQETVFGHPLVKHAINTN